MDAVAQVKSRVDLLDVVAQYTNLRRTGKNAKAICPFHSEKTPSFVVNTDRGQWRCFGACATGGDVFTFLMKAENIDFLEALKRLAAKAGVDLDYSRGKRQPAKDMSRHSRLARINRIADDWFNSMLKAKSADGARQYLIGRGIDGEVIKRNGIGYAPGGALTLRDKLKLDKVTEEDALTAGVLIKYHDGTVHDFFRDRITFRISNRRGEIVGFGARAMGDEQPKYINTPETPLFNKSTILYGIERAHEAIHKLRRAILVEGYMDVLAAHEHGFSNVIGTMGVALTEAQLESLQALLRGGELVLCLDGDSAGRTATSNALERTWSFANRCQIAVKVALPPAGSDPDEMIRKSPSDWVKLLETPAPALEFLMGQYAEQFGADSPEGKQSILTKMAPLIGEVRNDFARDNYVLKLAKLLNVEAGQLQARIGRSIAPAKANAKRVSARPPADVAPVATPLKPGNRHLEDVLLALLLNYPDVSSIGDDVRGDYWSDALNRHIFELWQSKSLNGELSSLEQERMEELNKLLEETPYDGDRELFAAANEIASRLKERYLKNLALNAAGNDEIRERASRELAEIYEKRRIIAEGGQKQ